MTSRTNSELFTKEIPSADLSAGKRKGKMGGRGRVGTCLGQKLLFLEIDFSTS